MHATICLDTSLESRGIDHRAGRRTTVSLPIFIFLDGTRYNAVLHNLSTGGASIVTSAPLALHMKIVFHCGAICSPGIVVWQRRMRSGIRFANRLCQLQLNEQVLRSAAVADWRDNYSTPGLIKT